MADHSFLSSTPLYSQLKELLRDRIVEGVYPPLSKMPSEHTLCRDFSVSRITVRQALGDLQKEGLIFKVHGKGTFVAKPKAFQNVSQLKGLGESLQEQGLEVINRLVHLQTIPCPKRVAQRLQLTEHEPVVQIKRIRLINREPTSLEITYLPLALGERLKNADLVSRDIFLILENDCGVELGHADLGIDAILADHETALLLAVEEGSPIMRIERLTHDQQGRPIDYEHLYYRGDAFQYRLRIDRHKEPQS